MLEDEAAAAAEAAILGAGMRARHPGRSVTRPAARCSRLTRRRPGNAAKRHRRTPGCELWREDAGTAALCGFGLPPDEALAADQRIRTATAELKAAGVAGRDGPAAGPRLPGHPARQRHRRHHPASPARTSSAARPRQRRRPGLRPGAPAATAGGQARGPRAPDAGTAGPAAQAAGGDGGADQPDHPAGHPARAGGPARGGRRVRAHRRGPGPRHRRPCRRRTRPPPGA